MALQDRSSELTPLLSASLPSFAGLIALGDRAGASAARGDGRASVDSDGGGGGGIGTSTSGPTAAAIVEARLREHRRAARKRRRRRVVSESDIRKLRYMGKRPFLLAPFAPIRAAQLAKEPQKRNSGSSSAAVRYGTLQSKNRDVEKRLLETHVVETDALGKTATEINRSQRGAGGPPKTTTTPAPVESVSTITVTTSKKRRNSTSSIDSSSSSSSSSSGSSSSYTRFSDLTRRQWATVGMLACANLASTVAFSCIAPFYPAEAQLKGMNTTDVGIVFGVFELIMFISAPLLGKYMSHIGSKRMFTFGLFITGFTAILFGFLNYLPNGIFFWASLVVRCFEALGDACFVTASFAIAAKHFAGRIATIVGLMETFAGLGYTAGPVIGALLYDAGGFQTPFLVLGVVLLITTVISMFLLNPGDEEEELVEKKNGITGMLKIPSVMIMVFAVVLCALSLSFFDPTLAGHLSSFNLTTTQIGFFFLLNGGLYTITAPLWGCFVDRWSCSNALMLFGSSASVIAMLFVGPSPLFNMDKSLVVIGLALSLFGVAAGALYIPTFQHCLEAVKERGYADNFFTYGCVSGIFQSAFAFGAFLGPTLGGVGVQKIGFGWTTTIISGLNVVFIICLGLFYCLNRVTRSRDRIPSI